jgi:hypothetical protein
MHILITAGTHISDYSYGMPAVTRSKIALIAVTALSLFLLTACGPANPDLRPEDSKLRDGITLLMKDLISNHPQMQNWKQAAVDAQLSKPLPLGISTPAGWKLTWANAANGELPYVYVPWSLTGNYPNHFTSDNATYKGGTAVTSTIIQNLSRQQFGDDYYFAAMVDVRYSAIDKHWMIFTTVPYLPVTDNAYGWATPSQGSWKIQDFGTALVGCGKVPSAVQSEFGLSCPKK